MPQISLVLNFSERGVAIVRLPVDYPMREVTATEQFNDPKCGLLMSSGALSDLVRALNDAISEATGHECHSLTIGALDRHSQFEWVKLNLQGSKLLPSQAAELKQIIDESVDH